MRQVLYRLMDSWIAWCVCAVALAAACGLYLVERCR